MDASGKLRGTGGIKEGLPPECRELSVSLYLELNVLGLHCVTLSEPNLTNTVLSFCILYERKLLMNSL